MLIKHGHRAIYKNCDVCGVLFLARADSLSRRGERFCSRKCGCKIGVALLSKLDRAKEKNGNWKGGLSKNHYHYKKLQVKRYPEKVNARESVHRAVRSGRLIKQPCKVCGESKVFAHHVDYSKPLEVEWLCRKHHREVHNNRH